MSRVAFNQAKYSESLKGEAAKVLMHSLDTGWIVTGEVVKSAEQECSALCEMSHAVGTLIAPYFPLAAALREFHSRVSFADPTIAIQANAWPEHVAAFRQMGWEIVLFDFALEDGYPKLEPDQIPFNVDAVFVLDAHGVAPRGLKDIQEVCAFRKIPLIHDVSYGVYANGKDPTRTIGDVITMSLNPGKLVTGLNGGMTLFSDEDLADLMRAARIDGLREDANCFMPVGDWRMQEVQAAVLMGSLQDASKNLYERRKIVDLYVYDLLNNPKGHRAAEQLSWQMKYSGLDRAILFIHEGDKPRVRDYLNMNGVQSIPLTYDRPANEHVVFGDLYLKYSTPNAKRWCETTILIPLHNDLSQEDTDRVCTVLKVLEF